MSVNPHLDLWRAEIHVSTDERRWLAWVAEVESMVGHSLDGDQDVDGYSLDYAHDAFADGLSATEYAAEIRA